MKNLRLKRSEKKPFISVKIDLFFVYLWYKILKMKHLKLRQELFWDVDFHSLDEEIHEIHIVQQVLNFGTLEEFSMLVHHYGSGRLKQAVKKVGYFDPKTFSFVIALWELDKKDLSCYTKKRLSQPHWN